MAGVTAWLMWAAVLVVLTVWAVLGWAHVLEDGAAEDSSLLLRAWTCMATVACLGAWVLFGSWALAEAVEVAVVLEELQELPTGMPDLPWGFPP